MKRKVDTKPKKKQIGLGTKFALSIGFDLFDFTIGRIPIFGTLVDAGGTMLSFWLWGRIGLGEGWELLDPTDQIDGFVPTVTIMGCISLIRDKINKAKEE
jgi:hypothetical protein